MPNKEQVRKQRNIALRDRKPEQVKQDNEARAYRKIQRRQKRGK